ncbi:MAG: YceI family protein [Candidatus Baltobacteraceae bacterium]
METQTALKTVYAIDPSHSMVEFSVRHLMISKVRGRFTAFQGSIAVPAGSDVPSELEVTIEAKSIDTHEAQRDTHLRSADFFHAEQFPSLTFKSTGIKRTSGGSFEVTGNLTMHGVKKSVTFDAEFEGRGNDPWGNQRVAYSAHTKLDRKDFRLNWNAALEAGGVMVSDEVKIELNVEASAAK